jgi:phospholipid/cholesterol/gamma-HCH transport system permease protein
MSLDQPADRSEAGDPIEPRALADRVSAWFTSFASYVGSLGLLALASASALFRQRRGQPRLPAVIARHLECLLALGVPLVGLVHVGLGSSMAMQAFFRATFAEANGAVVGLGLMRSVSPLVAGLVIASLVAARASVELVGGLNPGLDDEPGSVLDRDVIQGITPDPRPMLDPGRVVSARVIAAMLAGPLLALWGAAVGTVVGALLSARLLGVASGTYFGFFFEMLQVSDVAGVLVLGALYAGASALLVCHESLRAQRVEPPAAAPMARFRPAYRALVVSLVAMLAINSAWFNATYLSGGFSSGVVIAEQSR